MTMTRKTLLTVLTATLFACGLSWGQIISPVFYENFDGLTLMDSVNERLGETFVTRPADDPDSIPVPGVYSAVGPTGWTVNRSSFGSFDGVPGDTAAYNPMPTTGNVGVAGTGVAGYGVDEWDGWGFADKDFWAEAAGGQDRETFTNGMGTVAVADPDEYYDLGGPSDADNGGYFNTSMSTPAIPVTGGALYNLNFDSSWRDEAFDDDHPTGLLNANNQAVEIVARYDNGAAQVIAGWNSDPASPTFKNDAPNENLDAALFAPAGATSVTLEFNMANAGNDWWWAVDNLNMTDLVSGDSVYAEDFEGVALGDSVNERIAFAKVTAAESEPGTMARPDSFTNVPPAGWNIDNSGIPGGAAVRDDDGVYEFEGWTFMTREFWEFADGQGRGDFLKGEGNFAVADSDEYDDLGVANGNGPLDTLLETPLIDITTVADGQLGLSFDSAWRDESDQTALITAEFFDAAGNSLGTTEAVRWESDPASPNFHDDNTNESVLVGIDAPADAETMQLTFAYLNGSNNWFWAVDNIKVGTVPEPSSLGMLMVAMSGLLATRRRRS